jgi:multidrug efflux pump subunit AcrA (membrane-fusion protein)
VNYKFNLNNKHQEFNIPEDKPTGESFAQLLSNLERVSLDNSLTQANFYQIAYPPVRKNFDSKPATYITEINDRFYILDYELGFEPKPEPLQASIAKLQQPSTIELNKLDNLEPSTSFLSQPFPSLNGRKGLLIGIGLGVLLTVGGTRILSPTAVREQPPVQIDTATVPTQAVTTIAVNTQDINRTLSASGTIVAYERIPVMSQAGGLLIKELLAERGDFVERGQVLARLNDRILNAEKMQARGAVEEARAKLNELQAGNRVEEIARAQSRVANAESAVVQAKSNLDLVQKRVVRNQTLQAEGAISRDRLDEVLNQEQVAKSELLSAEASLNEARQELAQLRSGSRPQTIAAAEAELTQAWGRLQEIEAQLTDTAVTAPRAGIIASREAKVGQITSTSEQLFSIIQDGRLELKLQIPETLIGRIELGQKVKIASNADPSLKLTGKVREIEPTIDDRSRQATVKVDLPNNTRLKPGMFLQAAIDTDTSEGLAVPIEALLPQSGNTAIAFVLQPDNIVKAQTVKMGEILSEQKVEIVEGLNAGDRIVLKGAAYLKDGDRVVDEVASVR